MSRMMQFYCRALVWAAGVATAFIFVGPSLADSYELGTGDRLRITILDRPDLSGEFAINGSGTVGIPRLGRISVAGRTPEAVELEITDELRRRLGRTDVSVTVDIAAYRPFYVLGEVEKPGSYPYVPGINVSQAVALAGSYRAGNPSWSMLRLEAHRAAERLLSARLSLSEALARRARLEAERDGASEIAFPDSLKAAEKTLETLRANETDIFNKRRETLIAEIASLERQRKLSIEEISAMGSQFEAKQRQQSLLREEIKEFDSLLKRQLISVSRYYELQRLLAEMEATGRELQASIFRSRRELEKADRGIASIQESRAGEISTGLKESEQQIEALTLAARASRQQYDAADRSSRRFDAAAGGAVSTTFTISRLTKDGWTQIIANEFTPVRPDDILRVPNELPALDKLMIGQTTHAER